MHFSPPKLHRSKSKTDSGSPTRSTNRSERRTDGEGERSVPREQAQRDVGVEGADAEPVKQEKQEEEEEEVSEWIEGPDVVIERKSRIPGEDVQVEVLRGAACNFNSNSPQRKHSRGKKGKEEEEKFVGKCKEEVGKLRTHDGEKGHAPA